MKKIFFEWWILIKKYYFSNQFFILYFKNHTVILLLESWHFSFHRLFKGILIWCLDTEIDLIKCTTREQHGQFHHRRAAKKFCVEFAWSSDALIHPAVSVKVNSCESRHCKLRTSVMFACCLNELGIIRCRPASCSLFHFKSVMTEAATRKAWNHDFS